MLKPLFPTGHVAMEILLQIPYMAVNYRIAITIVLLVISKHIKYLNASKQKDEIKPLPCQLCDIAWNIV